MVSEFNDITIPPKHYSPDDFCRWVVKASLKSWVQERAIKQMGTHKWWIMRDFSKGKTTPECYAFFVNIDVNNPPISNLNTAIVFWNPVPFSWSIKEKIFRFIKKLDYPRKGDILQAVPLSEHISYKMRQMIPTAYKANDSRCIWQAMQALGWTLVAQGETAQNDDK